MRSTVITKYYYDLTRYNLGFSVLIGFLTLRLSAGIVTFGTFGMLVSLLCYKYFQSNQYYFYYNLGISKLKLISISWFINVLVAAILFWIIY
jgi:hypothetical protein